VNSRLTTLRPSISTLAPRVGSIPGDERSVDQVRLYNAPWRGWYKLKRWAVLRLEVFVRDEYRCQRTGVLCAGKHPAPDSPVANHKIPHRGDPVLFWDPNNIETVTKAVHDSIIQSEERAGAGEM
jgi:5-methylcytosine-specific restriction protein A